MIQPAYPLTPDLDIGSLDAHGQRIWSPEEEAAVARMEADPEFQAGLARAKADILAGRVNTMEEVQLPSSERRRKWAADTGRTPPPGYFDWQLKWMAEAEADRDRIWFFNAERSVERAERIVSGTRARTGADP